MNLVWEGLVKLANSNFRIELIVNYLKQLMEYGYIQEFDYLYNENKVRILSALGDFDERLKSKVAEICKYHQALSAGIKL